MSKVLEVTEDKVREAAKNCPDAKRVLETLFPSAFESEYTEPNISNDWIVKDKNNIIMMERRNSGNFKGSIYLSTFFNWEIKKDNENYNVLVAKRKK